MLVPIPPHGQHESMSITPDKKDKLDLYKVMSNLQTAIIKANSLNPCKIREQIPKNVKPKRKGEQKPMNREDQFTPSIKGNSKQREEVCSIFYCSTSSPSSLSQNLHQLKHWNRSPPS